MLQVGRKLSERKGHDDDDDDDDVDVDVDVDVDDDDDDGHSCFRYFAPAIPGEHFDFRSRFVCFQTANQNNSN